jgi:hypothetical protein
MIFLVKLLLNLIQLLLVSFYLWIEDKDKLYDDLRNDNILACELDRWIGYAYLKMGALTAVASTSLITFANVGKKSKPAEIKEKSAEIMTVTKQNDLKKI